MAYQNINPFEYFGFLEFSIVLLIRLQLSFDMTFVFHHEICKIENINFKQFNFLSYIATTINQE